MKRSVYAFGSVLFVFSAMTAALLVAPSAFATTMMCKDVFAGHRARGPQPVPLHIGEHVWLRETGTTDADGVSRGLSGSVSSVGPNAVEIRWLNSRGVVEREFVFDLNRIFRRHGFRGFALSDVVSTSASAVDQGLSSSTRIAGTSLGGAVLLSNGQVVLGRDLVKPLPRTLIVSRLTPRSDLLEMQIIGEYANGDRLVSYHTGLSQRRTAYARIPVELAVNRPARSRF